MNKNLKVGDYIKVDLDNNQQFEGIVIVPYEGGFACKVLERTKQIGAASWNRYSLKEDARFQVYDECQNITVISEAEKFDAECSTGLTESAKYGDPIVESVTFYVTPLTNDKYFTFCESNGFGGWTIHSPRKSNEALRESYFNSQVSKREKLSM